MFRNIKTIKVNWKHKIYEKGSFSNKLLSSYSKLFKHGMINMQIGLLQKIMFSNDDKNNVNTWHALYKSK